MERRMRRRRLSFSFQRLPFLILVAIGFSTAGPSFGSSWKFRLPGRRKDEGGMQQQPEQRASSSISLNPPESTPAHHTAEGKKTVAAEAGIAEDVMSAVDQATAAVRKQANRFFPTFVVPEAVMKIYHSFVDILLYKPPVGIVAVWATMRLIVTGRIFRLYQAPPKDSVEAMLQRENRRRDRKRHIGRSYDLDPDDHAYNSLGGVERIRRRLCWAALANLSEQQSETTTDAADDELLAAIVDTLSVTSRPGAARIIVVQQSIEPLARLERLMDTSKTRLKSIQAGVSNEQLNKVVAIASLTAEVRATDALLRVCRNRLVKTSFRLARTKEHWSRRVKLSKVVSGLLQSFLQSRIEGDRLRLSYAEAAYSAEVSRLGEIASILMDRPADMEESFLLEALKASEEARKERKQKEKMEREEAAKERDARATDFKSRVSNKMAGIMDRDWKLPAVTKYSIRWNAEGKGRFTIRKLDSSGNIEGSCAMGAILSDKNNDDWVDEARAWTQKARRVLCNVVRETLKGSATDDAYNETKFTELEDNWCTKGYTPGTDRGKEWANILSYVDLLPNLRRIGEGKVVRLADAALIDQTRRLDICGIPSTLLYIALANYVHNLVIPYWPNIKRDAIKAFWKTRDILKERVWVPAKGIWDEFMNKNPGIFSAFGVEAEQASLDRMLRDLNFGDGTPEMRQEALEKATEQYEHDLRTSLVKNLVGGKLVRLLLLQVQQLKVGLLSAFDTIDVLMKGNRIHFQTLAAIPAVLISYYGTRLFLRSLYSIRSYDIRPITAVHAEMDEYLNKMERLMLLAGQVFVDEAGRALKTPGKQSQQIHWKTSLSTTELGELLLNMHRYLILMDFTTPPFPSWHCDQIHSSLQELLSIDGTLQRMSTERHVSWLRLIKQKHKDLLKHL